MRASKALSGRKGTKFIGLVLAVALTATPAFSEGDDEARAPKKGPRTETKAISARMVAGGTTEINGWATFSGQTMASKDDDKDGQPSKEAAEAAGAEMIGGDWIYRPENEDFFIRWELTKIPVILAGPGGGAGVGIATTLYVMRFGAGEKSFEIRVSNGGQVTKDPVGNPTLPTAAAFGLFDCDEAVCTEVAQLKGGYGTTGERIVTALPLKVLADAGAPVKEGDEISGFAALSVFGQYALVNKDFAQTYDDILLSEKAVKIPKKSVTLTIKKTTVDANLNEGYFKATFPAKLFSKSKPTKVTSKTCLGEDCVTQTFMVQPSSS